MSEEAITPEVMPKEALVKEEQEAAARRQAEADALAKAQAEEAAAKAEALAKAPDIEKMAAFAGRVRGLGSEVPAAWGSPVFEEHAAKLRGRLRDLAGWIITLR